MKIFAIMLVKNEVDIVGSVLKSAEKWADKIFILDNGSTDGTWELIQSLKNDVITPWKQDFGPFRRGMRAEVFNEFRHLSTPGDWWCYALDADEFYIEDPRTLLQNISRKYQWVFKQSIDYRLTKEDVEEYNFTGDFESDRKYINYIRNPCWSEGRFFRYRKGLKWDTGIASQYPQHVGTKAPQTILVEHYQYRSPQQIQKRLDARKATKSNSQVSAWKSMPETLDECLFSRTNYVFFDKDYKKIKTAPLDFVKYKTSKLKDFIKRFLIQFGLYN